MNKILAENLCFGEGPRWHDGRLWLSDMHDRKVLSVSPTGEVSVELEIPDDEPSGLGWLPDGTLLIVAMQSRRLLRWDGAELTVHADLQNHASWHCNDMVVSPSGHAYVGNFGFDLHHRGKPKAAELIRVDPHCNINVEDNQVMFPNGTVITPDERTLIVGESFGGQLTAFDIASTGELSNKRCWAPMPDKAVADGICLDADMGIWVASPTTDECLRLKEGGEVTHRLALERGAFACMIGGNHLYVLTASSSMPDACRENRDGRIEVFPAPYPAAGWP